MDVNNKSFKVLFVDKVRGGCKNVAVMYLSAVLKEKGYSTDLVDYHDKYLTWYKLEKNNYRIVAMSATSFTFFPMLELARRIKKYHPEVIIIFGGFFVTVMPEVIKEDGIDAICIGEGEKSLLKFVNAISSGKTPTEIEGIWFKDNGIIYKNIVSEYNDNLNDLPFPDRSLYADAGYSLDNNYEEILVSRGCYYNCRFCSQNALNKEHLVRKYRVRSVDNIIEELIQVKLENAPDSFIFMDSIFPLSDLGWLEKFCVSYKKNINLPFVCRIRMDQINKENVKLLKIAGCNGVGVGIEHGNEQIRNVLMGKHLTDKDIIKGAEMLNCNNVPWIAYNIIGVPGTTIRDDLQSLKLNVRAKPTVGQALFFEPLPKSELTDIAIEKNLFDGDYRKIFSRCINKSEIGNIPFLKYRSHYLRKLYNIRVLFMLCIRIPILVPLMPLLISLPITRLYKLMEQFIDKISKLKK